MCTKSVGVQKTSSGRPGGVQRASRGWGCIIMHTSASKKGNSKNNLYSFIATKKKHDVQMVSRGVQRASRVCPECVRCPEGVQSVPGVCPECVQNVSGVQRVSRGCPENIQRVSRGCLEGVQSYHIKKISSKAF